MLNNLPKISPSQIEEKYKNEWFGKHTMVAIEGEQLSTTKFPAATYLGKKVTIPQITEKFIICFSDLEARYQALTEQFNTPNPTFKPLDQRSINAWSITNVLRQIRALRDTEIGAIWEAESQLIQYLSQCRAEDYESENHDQILAEINALADFLVETVAQHPTANYGTSQEYWKNLMFVLEDQVPGPYLRHLEHNVDAYYDPFPTLTLPNGDTIECPNTILEPFNELVSHLQQHGASTAAKNIEETKRLAAHLTVPVKAFQITERQSQTYWQDLVSIIDDYPNIDEQHKTCIITAILEDQATAQPEPDIVDDLPHATHDIVPNISLPPDRVDFKDRAEFPEPLAESLEYFIKTFCKFCRQGEVPNLQQKLTKGAANLAEEIAAHFNYDERESIDTWDSILTDLKLMEELDYNVTEYYAENLDDLMGRVLRNHRKTNASQATNQPTTSLKHSTNDENNEGLPPEIYAKKVAIASMFYDACSRPYTKEQQARIQRAAVVLANDIMQYYDDEDQSKAYWSLFLQDLITMDDVDSEIAHMYTNSMNFTMDTAVAKHKEQLAMQAVNKESSLKSNASMNSTPRPEDETHPSFTTTPSPTVSPQNSVTSSITSTSNQQVSNVDSNTTEDPQSLDNLEQGISNIMIQAARSSSSSDSDLDLDLDDLSIKSSASSSSLSDTYLMPEEPGEEIDLSKTPEAFFPIFEEEYGFSIHALSDIEKDELKMTQLKLYETDNIGGIVTPNRLLETHKSVLEKRLLPHFGEHVRETTSRSRTFHTQDVRTHLPKDHGITAYNPDQFLLWTSDKVLTMLSTPPRKRSDPLQVQLQQTETILKELDNWKQHMEASSDPLSKTFLKDIECIKEHVHQHKHLLSILEAHPFHSKEKIQTLLAHVETAMQSVDKAVDFTVFNKNKEVLLREPALTKLPILHSLAHQAAGKQYTHTLKKHLEQTPWPLVRTVVPILQDGTYHYYETVNKPTGRFYVTDGNQLHSHESDNPSDYQKNAFKIPGGIPIPNSSAPIEDLTQEHAINAWTTRLHSLDEPPRDLLHKTHNEFVYPDKHEQKTKKEKERIIEHQLMEVVTMMVLDTLGDTEAFQEAVNNPKKSLDFTVVHNSLLSPKTSRYDTDRRINDLCKKAITKFNKSQPLQLTFFNEKGEKCTVNINYKGMCFVSPVAMNFTTDKHTVTQWNEQAMNTLVGSLNPMQPVGGLVNTFLEHSNADASTKEKVSDAAYQLRTLLHDPSSLEKKGKNYALMVTNLLAFITNHVTDHYHEFSKCGTDSEARVHAHTIQNLCEHDIVEHKNHRKASPSEGAFNSHASDHYTGQYEMSFYSKSHTVG